MKISSALDAADSGSVVCHVFVPVSKVVCAQDTLDVNRIVASGTLNVSGPNLIVPPVTVSWKSELGTVPPNFVKWLLNHTIWLALFPLSLTLYLTGVSGEAHA